MRGIQVSVATIALLVAFGAVSATSARETSCASSIDPEDFVPYVDNPYFPLVPGTTFTYRGEDEGVPTSNVTEVRRATVRILGVDCIEVRDRAFEDGALVEETFDWYAQDRDGNVWYFGEDTTEFPSGSKEGSWTAGVDGALPGIIMEADPRVGDRYHQECAPGVAEDMAQVSKLGRSVTVPYGSFDEVVQTKEWTPLERGVVEQKLYAPNVGFVRGEMVKGGSEYTELVDVTRK